MAAATNPKSITALLQRSTLDDHEEILNACSTALKKSGSDAVAQHAKAVALLKLERYNEALQHFTTVGESLQEKTPLEYAYSLYKGGKPKEAAELAAKVAHGRGLRHVEAQALYQIEDFEAAKTLYEQLSSAEIASEQNELRINRGAVEAQLIWAGNKELSASRRPGREDLEAFETAYNVACASIARGELRQAEVLLKRAKELCKHSEDLSEEEKVAELLPMSIQQLYVLGKLGKDGEAQAIGQELRANDISNTTTRSIAQQNLLVTLPRPSNPFITHKMLSRTPEPSGSKRPFQFQKRILDSNTRVLDLQALKYDGVAKSTTKLLDRTPSTSANSTIVQVLNAAAHARGQEGKSALKHMLPELERSPFNIGLLLTLIQMQVTANNSTSATILLESFFGRLEQSSFDNKYDVRFNPGLVAIAVALYRSQGRKANAAHELEQAASYWRQRPDPPTSLLQSAGAAILDSGNPESLGSAAEIFTKLHTKRAEDRVATAGYVAALSATAVAKVKAEADQLTPVSRLVQGVDVDALENAGIPLSSNALAIAQQTAARKRSAPDQGPNKRKRIRKSRLPKDYEADKAPDPERWLPLRDRSTYRPKGKKGKKRDADRTQGGVVAEDVGVKDMGTVARPAGGGGGGGGSGGGGAGNKKKKKGKK